MFGSEPRQQTYSNKNAISVGNQIVAYQCKIFKNPSGKKCCFKNNC